MENELEQNMAQPGPGMDDSNAIPEDEGMNPDDAAAALGFATTLSQQLLPQEEEQGNEETETEDKDLQTEQETTEEKDPQVEDLKTEIMGELESIREEIRASKGGDEEIERLKKEIEAVLNEDDNEK